MALKIFKHTVNQLRKDSFENSCKNVASKLGLKIDMQYDGLEYWIICNGYRFLITIEGDDSKIKEFRKICL